jgi:hypothetical protein
VDVFGSEKTEIFHFDRSAAPLQVPKSPFEDEEDQFVDARLWQAFESISVHQAARNGNLEDFKTGLQQSGEEMLFIADDVANATVRITPIVSACRVAEI